jgi:hypothetical protein
MSKFTNLASGLLGGYVAYKQGQERRQDRKDSKAMNAAVMKMLGGNKEEKAAPAANPNTPVNAEPVTATNNNGSMSKVDVTAVPTPVVEVAPVDPDKKMRMGGMVGKLPSSDRFSWQRQSFKK